MDIYYMLGHLCWVQFSNGVSVNTHKGLALEILMIMAHILDEGVPSLSFRLEGVEQVDPYEYIWELLGFQKGASEQVYVHEGTLEGFWSVIVGGAHQQRNSIRTPSSKYVTLLCKWIFGENERDKDNQHGVELALLGFDCLVANRPHSTYDQPVVFRVREILVRVLPLHVGYLFKTGYYKEPRASPSWDFPRI
jgi:hypothetical protein